MLDNHMMKTALRNYIQFFNDRNLADLVALYADDATIEDPFGKSLLQGREAIVAMYTHALAGPAQLELVAPPRGSFGDAAAITFIVHTGGSMIHVTDVMTFNESGKITSMRAYWGPDDQEAGE